jgi:LytS/YehU family sensor histidine kinase
MNPHFIFNSLNSVQNFILEKDNMVAGLYLAKFSSLMRKILDNSKKNTISLKEEIETIKLYLNLEKLRFEEQFYYTLTIDEKLNTDEIQIPTMIIQPYLENAVRHGLVPLKSMGLLKVQFKSYEDHKLMVVIEDNGIGRVKSGEISKKRLNYKSTGMKNTENRIRLLNELNKTNMKVKVIDLHNENGDSMGTRIELLF